ncbi:choice-of-anchor Q domain-containing protein [Pseudomarimonas arenosa]|uniref:Right handed beta helix domain-containing protein n=1 Tax=Pseudomarimonas arenosa TaxID=2774145 RepID=A0AAW3ZN81_9GAMM|nr:choice-of-anchor Q domain-containing protein [Pseudomarimonas arenosa]MBD8525756.1 hypothetical protein [Pseudomarimonas arenosa]
MNAIALISLSAALGLALSANSAAAQSFCAPVVAESTGGAVVLGNGSPNSFTTAQLQAALDAGGVIRLNLGAAPTTFTVTQTLQIGRAVVLDGGGTATLSGAGLRQIMYISSDNPAPDAPLFTVTLQNISFRDGNTAGGRGGAIYKEQDFEFPHKVSLKLVNCRFDDNVAALVGSAQDDGGGAFYGEQLNRIDIGNCVFSGNSGSNGGALYSLGSLRLNIVDSRFEDNHAIGSGGNPGNGGNGGAIGVDGAERLVDICRTQLVDNSSNAFGGAFFSVMYDMLSRSRFEDVLVQGNRQLSSSEHSGGLYLQDGPWALERVSVIDNEARGFGGLFVAGDAPGTIRNATFSGNVARTGLGAAMALTSTAPIDIVNTTIANNVSTDAFAAGISIGASNQLRLTNVLFANNSGGNRFVNWAMNNPASLDGGGNRQWPQTRPMDGGNETPVTSTAVFSDPMLPAMAADNGGAVPTLALPVDSTAINAGVLTALVPNADARCESRVGAVDVGSYERQPQGRIFRDGFDGC